MKLWEIEIKKEEGKELIISEIPSDVSSGLYQVSMTEIFAKVFNQFQPLTIFVKELSCSRVPLFRTSALSNFALTQTKTLVSPAFTIHLVKICPAIWNIPLSRTTFSVPKALFCRYLELFFQNLFVETFSNVFLE